ncbi:MAG TPA: large conductance mechanosensitive channel protein MscL [Candidatus Limnocylindria bacterium]|nr:large conductance mechanosensitive channel protein MscL [Candidatus Limnocylindria bacterium]
MVREFRDFLLRGNVIDLAVAVVIGAAFGAVITSFVTNILTPLLGLIGVPNFEELSFQAGEATVSYGLFLNALIYFVLVALAIFFFVVKPVNALAARRAGTADGEPTTKACPYCASEIAISATRCPMCTSQLTESA